MLIKTLLDVFPLVSLWLPTRDQGVAIASHAELRIDDRLMAQRMRTAQQAIMSEYGLGSAEDLLATFIAADERLRAFAAGAEVITDNFPRIEQYNRYPIYKTSYSDLRPFRSEVSDRLVHAPQNPAVLEKRINLMQAVWENRGDKPLLEAALAEQPENEYLRDLLSSAAQR